MLTPFNSQKIRFWAFISMLLLVFVHGYNLNQGYLQPWTIPGEPLTITTFTEYWLSNGIFRFRIPMLFIISGYLFALSDNKLYKQRADKRVRTLLYPYLMWSAFGLLLTFLLELFPFGKDVVAATYMMQLDENRMLLHQYHWYEIIARWILFPLSYQLWFIRVLFVYNLAYPAIKWFVTNKIAKPIFFSIAILFWLSTGGLILIEGEGLLFFSLGIWIQKTNFNIDMPNKWLVPKFWLIIFIVLSAVKTVIAFAEYFAGAELVLIIMHKLTVLSGLVYAWYGCNALVKFCMKRKWFVWLSAFSFMIYVLHAPLVVYATKAFFMRIDNWYGYRMFTYILLPLLLIAMTILFGALLRKLMPKVYSFVTGGRGL
jgi:fucose 4-O-acetylase-like acetyltransferase